MHKHDDNIMIVWHVGTSSGSHFEWARDEEDLRCQVIDYYNEVHTDATADRLPDGTELDDAIKALEEFENFSQEKVYGGHLLDDRERDNYVRRCELEADANLRKAKRNAY